MRKTVSYMSKNTTIITSSDFNDVNKVLNNPNYVYIVDECILELYDYLFNDNCSRIIPIKGGENAKSFESYQMITTTLANLNISRQATIVAIGGGTITDLVGFVGATYKRGTKLIFIPTTLIGMVDAAIGGKNGLNIFNYKNQIGTFYQPDAIVISTCFLHSSSLSSFKEGMSEIIKCAIISDIDLFNNLKNNYYLPSTTDSSLKELIEKTIKIKIDLTLIDEFDCHERQKLNFGHTLGHAIESCSSFTTSHGKAVATGMIYELKSADERNELLKLYKFQDIEYLENLDIDSLKENILKDKKVNSGVITYPVIKKIGRCELISTSVNEFLKNIKEEL